MSDRPVVVVRADYKPQVHRLGRRFTVSEGHLTILGVISEVVAIYAPGEWRLVGYEYEPTTDLHVQQAS